MCEWCTPGAVMWDGFVTSVCRRRVTCGVLVCVRVYGASDPVIDVAIQADGAFAHIVSLDCKGFVRVWNAANKQCYLVGHVVVGCHRHQAAAG